MSDNDSLVKEVLRKYKITEEQLHDAQLDQGWDTHQRMMFMQGHASLAGQPKTRIEFAAQEARKVRCKFRCLCSPDMIFSTINLVQEIERESAKKAEENNIKGYLRALHQGMGEEFFLKVMVDTGATVNAITYGILIDYQLETRKVRMEEPQVLRLAVGKFECSEQISINWMGKGNEEHDTATFYILPRGQANLTDRVILSREWLSKRGLLYDKDESDYLKPLIGGRQSVCKRFES